MSIALILMLLAPLAGAVLAWSFGEVAFQRRVLVTVSVAAALGGAATALVRSMSGSGVAWRGFAADPWHAFLAAGALVAIAAAVARADDSERGHVAQAFVFASGAGGVAALFVGGAHLLAATLPLVTIGIACSSLVLAADGSRGLRARRAVAGLAVSDVLTLIALGSSLGRSTALPPTLPTTAGALMLAAALIRLGLVPAAWPGADAARAHPSLGLLWLGPVRAQGFLLLLFALGAGRGVAYAAAAAGAATVFVAGIWRDPSEDGAGASIVAAGTGIAVLGFALGGPVALWGGLLAAAATFLAPAWAAGRGWSDAARLTLGALPAGGAFAGAALVTAVALQAGAVRPGYLALALPAVAGLVGLGARALSERNPAARGEPVLAAAVASIAAAGALALAALPGHATSGLAFPIADALGRGRLLTVAASHGGIGSDLGVVMVGAGLLAFAFGPGRAGSGGAPGVTRHRRDGPDLRAWWAAPGSAPSEHSVSASVRANAAARRWGFAAALLFVAVIALALRVYVVASGHGFL